MCVSACGRSNMPPSVWQSLWCSAMPTEPRQAPARKAPYCASERASRSPGSAAMRGSARPSAAMLCSASAPMIGLAVLGIERLDRMRDGIDARRAGQARRQRHGQVDVVDHHFGQHLQRPLRGLPAVPRLAEDRRHLGAGIGGRDGDLRQVGAQRDRLGQADRRAAAERHQAVGAGRAATGQRVLGDLDRRVHGGVRVERGEACRATRPAPRRPPSAPAS